MSSNNSGSRRRQLQSGSSELNFTECEASTFRGNRQHSIDTLEATLARDLKIFKHTKAKDLRDRLLKRDLILAPSIEENELSDTYSDLRWVDQNISLEQRDESNDPDMEKVGQKSKTKSQSEASIQKAPAQLQREKQKISAITSKKSKDRKGINAKTERDTVPKPESALTLAAPQLNGENSMNVENTSTKNDKIRLLSSDNKISASDLPSRASKNKYSKINSSLAGYVRAETQPRHVSKIQMSAHQVLLLDPSNLFQRLAPSQESLEAEYARYVFNAGDLFYFIGKLTLRDLGLLSMPKYVVNSGIYLWLADILQPMTKVNEMHLQLPVIQYRNKAAINVQVIPLKRTKREYMSIIHSGKLPTPVIMDNCLMCESKDTRQASDEEITLNITKILENCALQKQPHVLLWIRIDPLLKNSPSLRISFPVLYCVKSNNK